MFGVSLIMGYVVCILLAVSVVAMIAGFYLSVCPLSWWLSFPGSPTFALDIFGYTFLCLSTLAAAFALQDPREKALRVLCLIHGALAIPTVAAPIMSAVYGSSGGQANDIVSWVLLFWCVLFTRIAVLFSRVFRDGRSTVRR